MEKLTITIGADGNVTVGVECIKGKKCKDVTREIERALGKTTGSTVTREFYEKENQHAENRRG